MSILDDHKHKLIHSPAGDVTGVVVYDGNISDSEIRDLLEKYTESRAEYNDPIRDWYRWVPTPTGIYPPMTLRGAEEGKPGAFFATTLDVR